MEYQAADKCFMLQETCLLIDEVGGKPQAKSVVMCQMTPFVITKEGDGYHFTGGKMENSYPADEQYFNFLEGQVRELKAEKNQSILATVFRVLTGSRYRMRRRQVTAIPPTLVTLESTPTSDPYVGTLMTPPAPSKTEQDETALEQLVPIPIVEIPMQPSVYNQLGGSYIIEMQVKMTVVTFLFVAYTQKHTNT